MGDEKNSERTPEKDSDGETVNDPLTRSDVEARRDEFQGRRPEE